jgi:hypothetical protein
MFLRFKNFTIYSLLFCSLFMSCKSDIVIEETNLEDSLNLDLVDDANDSQGFAGGSHYGTKYENNKLTLDLDSSKLIFSNDWTPSFANLVAYWPLNNDYSDSIGSSNGTSGGSIFSGNAKLGTASVIFDGDDYTRFPDSADLQMGENSFSISVWIYPISITTSQRIINNRGTGAGGAPAGYQLGVDSAGVNLWRINNTALVDQSNNISSCSSCGSAYPTNSWYHLVLSYDADNAVNVYVNGELDYTSPVGALGSLSNTLPTALGAAIADAGVEGTFGQYFNGQIDEVAIWNGTFLSPTEVKTIFNKQKARAVGEFHSRVMRSPKNLSSWKGLSVKTTIPFLKELTGDNNADLAPDSEVSSEYEGIIGTLSDGLKGMWNFNEVSWNGTAGEVIDSSGNGKHMTSSGGISNSIEKIGKGVQFDGVDDLLRINPTDDSIKDNFTFSFWAKPGKSIDVTTERTSSTDGVNGENYALYPQNSNYIAPANAHAGTGVSVGTNGIGVFEHSGGYLPGLLFHPIQISDWINITVVYTNNRPSLYVNGKFIKVGLQSPKTVHLSIAYLGASPYGKYLGSLDELAIWDKVLTPAEILELYRRGGNRVKYQVRSCALKSCSGESWKGPDGTAGSYYSELQNRKASGVFDSTGEVSSESLKLLFMNHTAIASNPFFQYKVLLESDDNKNLCSGSPCLPSVKSVSVSQ